MKEYHDRTWHTTWERLFITVENLASGEERIKTRLHRAIIHLLPLQVKEFPEELQADFREITEYDKPLEEVITDMSNEQASKVVRKIVHIYDVIAREYCS